jgi:serine protease AprX
VVVVGFAATVSFGSPVKSAMLFAAIAAGLLSPADAPASADRGKVSASVRERAALAPSVDVLIHPAASLRLQQGVGRRPFADGVRETVDALRAHADGAHAPLLALLRAQGVEARSLWIANVVAATVTSAQLDAIAARDDVARIESDAPRQMAWRPIDAKQADATSETDEPHLVAMRVPEAWTAGARGAGVVVGGQDTGYTWAHPALRERYRGWNGSTVDHRHHWFDAISGPIEPGSNPCGYSTSAPCDDGSHGTHTMGTAVGDGGPGQRIGVAPDARWIGCRNMDRGIGRPSTYLDCFQFFIAPTDPSGNDPQPSLAPHVLVNSWSCPTGAPPAGEDCALDSFDTALANIRAAGILAVVAAGNGQARCGSIADPPAIVDAAFTVGATRNDGTIAPFSLWGPVTIDGSNRLKPDVTAPGVEVRSAVSNGGYARLSGTSMATPGAAGVAALMMGANPLLVGQPAAVGHLLRASATPAMHIADCGGYPGQASPNPVFGHGRVDALAAVTAATDLAVSPGHAGAWYDPTRDGEGWILQILADGRATLLWFTYPTAGEDIQQEWLLAPAGVVDGEHIRFDEVLRFRGGRFGEGFDPVQVEALPWGRIDMRFDGCGAGSLAYAGPDSHGRATRRIRRLTGLQGIPCGRPFAPTTQNAAARSGAWYDPARSGEGWLLEVFGEGRVALYWFTFDPDGRPAWLFGVGSLDGDRLLLPQLLRATGPRFGEAFRSEAFDPAAWGSLEIDFAGCNAGVLKYRADDPAWGIGERRITRLTRLFGIDCSDTR